MEVVIRQFLQDYKGSELHFCAFTPDLFGKIVQSTRTHDKNILHFDRCAKIQKNRIFRRGQV